MAQAVIHWIPGFGLQRELDWLRNMDDWMISKKRFWGLALPIFKCDDCGHVDVIGSETELEARAVEGWEEFAGHSPHRPWIDSVKIQCADCEATVSRIRDVGNVWLDAGIVPFSTIGYRNDRDHWKDWFPADWISESFPGQFRGWFYSLLVMSTVLEDTEPFRNLYSYATMRDEKGDEMHKSKGNAIWFEDGAERMGVDAMRWLYSRQSPVANLNFGFGAADEVRRRFIIPLWNVYSFFVTYANIDGYDPSSAGPPVPQRPELDRWILSELNSLTRDVTASLDGYEPEPAARRIEGFVEDLSNWYVRRSRRRFWKSDADDDKLAAYSTLFECLETVTRLLAPFVPFVTESIYRNLARPLPGARESVHLESYPEADEGLIDEELSQATRLAMRLSSLGRAARSQAGIKVRQPLERVLVKLRSADEEAALERVSAQVCDELNVKELAVLDDESMVSRFDVRADMSKIGPKYARRTREVLAALSSADPKEVARQVLAGSPAAVGEFTLEPDEIVVTSGAMEGYSVASEGGYTVAAPTEISRDLRLEGDARELVHLVQNMRRSAGLDIADKIVTYYEGDPALDEVVEGTATTYGRRRCPSRSGGRAPPAGAYVEEHKVNGLDARVGVLREPAG